jgi:pimeloyl-ACP methyl ester carboxylesterase
MPMVGTADSGSLFVSDWAHPGLPPVVLLHAWGLNGDMWSAQVPALVKVGLRPVTHDQRSYGRSDPTGHNYDLDALADDLASMGRPRSLHQRGVPLQRRNR